jgi:hypothetical protein
MQAEGIKEEGGKLRKERRNLMKQVNEGRNGASLPPFVYFRGRARTSLFGQPGIDAREGGAHGRPPRSALFVTFLPSHGASRGL